MSDRTVGNKLAITLELTTWLVPKPVIKSLRKKGNNMTRHGAMTKKTKKKKVKRSQKKRKRQRKRAK